MQARNIYNDPKTLIQFYLKADTAGGLSVRHRPRTNGPQLAGLAANTTAADDDGCRAGKWGECDVLALRKAGSDLPILSLPQLSPLPVTVPTHSLNFEQPNLAPN